MQVSLSLFLTQQRYFCLENVRTLVVCQCASVGIFSQVAPAVCGHCGCVWMNIVIIFTNIDLLMNLFLMALHCKAIFCGETPEKFSQLLHNCIKNKLRFLATLGCIMWHLKFCLPFKK